MTRGDQNEGRDGLVSDLINAICQNSPIPCLVLSRSRTVLAANDGARRLMFKSSEALVGKVIHELGFITVPTQSPRYRDVEALLDDCPFDQQPNVTRQSDVKDHNYASEEDFWNQEDQKACASLDVIVPREAPIQGQKSLTKLTQIRARLSVRHLRLGSDPMYMIMFDRPRSERVPLTSQSASEKSRTPNASGEEDPSVQIAPQDVQQGVSKAIPYITAKFNVDGQATQFSEAWYGFFGTRKEENLGTGWFNVMHPEDVGVLATARVEATKNSQNSWSREARYRSKEGSYRWFIVRATSSKDDAGSITGWNVSMMDIDELVKSRQEAGYWKGSIMTLLSDADVCFWGLTADRILFMKEGSLAWDPVAALEIPSEDVTHVRHTQDQSSSSIESIEDAVKAVSKGRIASLRLDHQDSGRWYQSILVADYVHSSNGGSSQSFAVLGLTIDTTDARARAELETEKASLVIKERLAKAASESKSRFLANTSHELRTPIAGIIGLNNLLKETLAEKQQREFSDSINLSAGLLLTLVNDVLDLSKIEAGRMEIEAVPFRVAKLVDTIRSVMTVQADQKGLEFQCVFADVPPGIAIVGDPNRLQQVLLNLLSNSIKFTDSGSVTMAVIRVKPDESPANDGSHSSGSNEKSPSSVTSETVEFEFVVEDTGCGMDTDTITKSFKAFSQANSSTARQYGGTGLGLTISRQLVDMMGGTLRLTSTPSVGTTARFQIVFPQVNTSTDVNELPLVSKATSNVSHEIRKAGRNIEHGLQKFEAEGPDVMKNSEKGDTLTATERTNRLVLIADDNGVNLRIAVLMIEKLGFQVISAKNGKEALDVLCSRVAADLAPPDVILMDCMMPIKDGYEATRDLRSHDDRFSASLRNIPIVALTANATNGEQKKCLDAGMDDYLTKPINKAALQQTLDKWCLSGRA